MTKIAMAISSLFVIASQAAEVEVSGKIGLEGRYFNQQPQWSKQSGQSNLSVFAEPELYWSWNDNNDSVIFKPFLRYDQSDSQRSHVDVRELTWDHVGQDWELRAGYNKVYWGVTEFQHLVDVINQIDSVEDIDGEDKLGQPMVNLSLVRDWGIIDVMVMPGFRERTFAGSKGRLRSAYVVNTDRSQYESSRGDNHIDYALRWTASLGNFDIGSAWFHGTNRDPILIPTTTTNNLTETKIEFTPYYEQMDQVSFDVQATLGDWLWKFEGLYRNATSDNYFATQSGFEYTQVGVFNSIIDVGYLVEYGWDSRGENSLATNQNDLFVGTRLAFNDVQSTEFLMGAGFDLDHSARSLIVEASRRLGDSYKLNVDIRMFSSSDPFDLISQINQDDHIQLTLEKYF